MADGVLRDRGAEAPDAQVDRRVTQSECLRELVLDRRRQLAIAGGGRGRAGAADERLHYRGLAAEVLPLGGRPRAGADEALVAGGHESGAGRPAARARAASTATRDSSPPRSVANAGPGTLASPLPVGRAAAARSPRTRPLPVPSAPITCGASACALS